MYKLIICFFFFFQNSFCDFFCSVNATFRIDISDFVVQNSKSIICYFWCYVDTSGCWFWFSCTSSRIFVFFHIDIGNMQRRTNVDSTSQRMALLDRSFDKRNLQVKYYRHASVICSLRFIF